MEKRRYHSIWLHRKWETHARVFSQTLAHGNSKMKYDKETEEGKKRDVSMARSKTGTKEKEVPTAYHYLIKVYY